MAIPRLPHELSSQWLRSRFSPERQQTHAPYVDGNAPAGVALREASVLIPVIEREPELTVLFTRRTDHLQAHAGQISFPGGGVEPGDASPIATALRETEEEIGLPATRVEVLGHLGEHHTGTGFRVTPVVGLIRPPFELRPDDFEVAEIFEVPLAFFLDTTNHKRGSMLRDGKPREFDAMPYGNYYIWGATASMLRRFHAYLAA